MNPGAGLLLLLAVLAANLPFLANRWLFVVPLGRPKHMAWRLGELVAWYFVIGAVARLMEGRLATPQAQGWEFYAVTACLFIVFAFPGFAYRYLWRLR